MHIVSVAGLALNYILQNNFKENVGMRPNARRIGVLITDGKSQDDVIVNSQNLREEGIELYAIGKETSLLSIGRLLVWSQIPSVCVKLLMTIASIPVV